MFNTEALVHYINVEVAPSCMGKVFCLTVYACPVVFFELATHHGGDLRGKQSFSEYQFIRGECCQRLWSSHLNLPTSLVVHEGT